MNGDDALVEKSEGAKQIQKFCSEAATDLGLKLENIYWSFEYVKPPETERHVLNVEAKDGTTTEIRFSRAEIEAYPTGHGVEKANRKIKMELEGLL